MHRLLLLLAALLLVGCPEVTLNEAPELEGDDPGECDDDADNDADGLFDCDDPDCDGSDVCSCEDADGDGICDEDDECEGGPDDVDTDGDGTADYCDPCPDDPNDDSDGDTVCDSDDVCPGEDDRVDPDGDGIPSGCDVCPDDPLNDSDEDTVCDSVDICLPGDDRVDHDNDGTPTDCDDCPFDEFDDSDGDGVCDSVDECPGGDDTIDLDGNGVPDDCDGGPGVLLLADGSGTVYELDEDGNTLDQWTSPVSGLTGVAHDRSAGDGFWVVGNGDRSSLYKVDWSGATAATVAFTSFPADPYEVRGLDYHVDAAGGPDRIALIGVNVNNIDVIWNIDVTTGARMLESSHYSGGFLSGFWGVHQTGQAIPSDWARWTSWSDGSLQLWNGSQSFVQSVGSGVSSPKGLSVTPGGDFWVVDAATDRVLHLSSTGALLDEFPTPGSDPLGLSYWE